MWWVYTLRTAADLPVVWLYSKTDRLNWGSMLKNKMRYVVLMGAGIKQVLGIIHPKQAKEALYYAAVRPKKKVVCFLLPYPNKFLFKKIPTPMFLLPSQLTINVKHA